MYLLGISAWYHDSAACIIKDDEILAAVQEERFSRIKNDSNFPLESIKYCLREANITPAQIENVVFYEKPLLKFERIIETYFAFAPRGLKSFLYSMPLWIKDKIFQKKLIIDQLRNNIDDKIDWKEKLLFSEHHLSHSASAFFPSPFKSSAILTLDGVGEWVTTSISVGNDNKIKIIKELYFPHSLGLLYSAFTYYIGFKVNSGEYKLMGLAPYGNPTYVDLIKKHLIKIKEDGSFKLNLDYFDYCTGLKMTNHKFHKLFGGNPRNPENEISQKEMDIACSIQKITEEIMLKIGKHIVRETGEKNLCLAGGVALNSVANGILLKENIFENIWVQPAAGDAGCAIGAALAVYYLHKNKNRVVNTKKDKMKGSYLGPSYEYNEIKKILEDLGAKFRVYNDEEIVRETGKEILNQSIVGWMQGRMEFGPRALGTRSILADPRSSNMQKRLNLKIKYRESFRPFAPSVLDKYASDWFDIEKTSPYMLFITNIIKDKQKQMTNHEKNLFGIDKLNVKRSDVPAITHVDYSARIQTVDISTNPLFYKLIEYFYDITSVPMLVNTSFNVRGEPIVCSPQDAFNCFMSTGIDVLVIGNFLLKKIEQDQELIRENKYLNEDY